MSPFETRTVEAFLRAIAELEKPLSPDLQQDIRKLGHALENHEPESVRQIPILVKQDSDLKRHYDDAYRSLQKQYQIQERAKSLAIATNGSVALDLESQIAQILNTDDITTAVQRFVTRLDTQLADQANQTDFWERGDRVLALTAGGAALGGLIAQIPGAIVGGVLAATFAGFTKPATASEGTAIDQETAVLKALQKRPLTPQNLIYAVNLPAAQTQAVVQSLWQKGDIDCTTGSLLHSLFPMLRNRTYRDREIDSNTYLTLTIKGYFRLHPFITPSQKGKRA